MRGLRIITKHREEMRRFGRRFWLRNLRRITKEGLRAIHLNGMEPIYVRPGESDLEVVHEVFFARHFDIQSEAVRDRVGRRARTAIWIGVANSSERTASTRRAQGETAWPLTTSLPKPAGCPFTTARAPSDPPPAGRAQEPPRAGTHSLGLLKPDRRFMVAGKRSRAGD